MVAFYTPPTAVGSPFNVVIGNNYISSNSSTVDNISVSSTYNYFQGIVTAASSLIDGNLISGISKTTSSGSGTITSVSGTTTFVQFFGASISKMTNNILTRGSENIDAYVNNGTSLPQIVVDNIFDSPFIDALATNISLDAGTLVGSNYSRNINQTSSISISLMDYARYTAGGSGLYSQLGTLNPDSTGPAYPEFVSSIDKTVILASSTSNFSVNRITNGTAGSEYTWIQLNTELVAAPHGFNFAVTVPLDYLLPTDVKIVTAILGVGLNEIGAAQLAQLSEATNQISLSLVQYGQTSNVSDVLANLQMSYGIPLDASVVNTNSFTVIVYEGNAGDSDLTGVSQYVVVHEAAIMNSTQYCTVTPTAGSLMTGPGGGYKISVEVDMCFNAIGNILVPTPGSVNWYLSPIVVQYRW